MGCIVNGPGEMADADYGYVGTGKGKITLYKEQTVIERNIPEDKAVSALIDLIKNMVTGLRKLNYFNFPSYFFAFFTNSSVVSFPKANATPILLKGLAFGFPNIITSVFFSLLSDNPTISGIKLVV